MKYANATEYAEVVVKRFITEITDNVFLAIEHDAEALSEYLSCVDEFKLKAVNPAIGKKVKELLKLGNEDIEGKHQSDLIKTYTRHKLKDAQ